MNSPAHSSALILFHMPYLPKLALNVQAYGDPESIRKAIRRACSRRRSIVTLRPTTFFCNLVHALVCHGLDITSLSDYRTVQKEDPVRFLYEIKFIKSYPFIVLGENGLWKEDPIPLFEFLGHERRAETKPRNLSGKKLGRPSRIKALVAAKRLNQALADGAVPDDVFLPAPEVEPGKEIWRETLRERTREKGRRLGKRLVRVDFDLMQKPDADE